jgi:hypothetical protein
VNDKNSECKYRECKNSERQIPQKQKQRMSKIANVENRENENSECKYRECKNSERQIPQKQKEQTCYFQVTSKCFGQ